MHVPTTMSAYNYDLRFLSMLLPLTPPKFINDFNSFIGTQEDNNNEERVAYILEHGVRQIVVP